MPLPLHLLRRHLIPIEAHFDWSLAVVWSWPQERLRSLCGPGLELDTFEGNAFVALAIVKTRALRVKGTPEFCGRDFILAGYRLFTRYTCPEGRKLRGLKILGGGADSLLMTCLGSLATHYRYRKLRIEIEESGERLNFSATGGHRILLSANLDHESQPETPPEGSVFADLCTARRFAGPMPYTFDYEHETHSMIRVEGVRREWHPRPVNVEIVENSFFDSGVFAGLGPGRLANAFLVRDVDYEWRRGIVERITGHD